MRNAIAMRYVKLAGVFVLTAAVCFVLELAVMLIPQAAIQKNSESSALYFRDKLLFQERILGYENTTVDYYADCLLLNLIYEMDTSSPVSSVIRAAYYDGAGGDTATDFLEAVFDKREPGVMYGRYWHGSMVYLRPLLAVTDIEGIYRIFAVLAFGGVLLNTGWLLCQRELQTAICFLGAFLLSGGFWMASCIEYANVLMLTLLMIPLFRMADQKGEDALYAMCVMDGAITCFADFLTAETLTVTLPLLVVLCARRCRCEEPERQGIAACKEESQGVAAGKPERQGIAAGKPERQGIAAGKPERQGTAAGKAVRGLAAWGCAYGGMFLLKWMLCAIAEGIGSVADAFGRAGGHMQGSPVQALWQNIRMLLPLLDTAPDYAVTTCTALYVLLLAAAVICLLRRLPAGCAAGIMLTGAVPYLRYVLLSEHSTLHCFFTCRAQMAALFVLLFAVSECITGRSHGKNTKAAEEH